MPFPSDPPRKPVSSIPEADELFRNASPNPDRLGCPPREVLEELARHERPINDSWLDHLAECSPCYQEFQTIRAQLEKRTFGRRLWIAAAAIAFVTLCGLWLFRWTRVGVPERREARAPGTGEVVVATLDLRRTSPLRGEGALPSEGVPVIPKGRTHLRILLPVGAEPGSYLVEIRGDGGTVMASASGEAMIVDFVTTLVVDVDTAGVEAGSHRLAIRHEEESWREYSVRVE